MRLGLSAQAIAGSGIDHPWDPSDLLRCINYCESSGISTEALGDRMKHKGVYWARLLPHWDTLVALLRHEMEARTDGNAPQTYKTMRRIIDNGIACTACDGTGRGTECIKCKGTGRRPGGRCRTKNCYSGADSCHPCRGRGYTLNEQDVTK